MNEKITATGNAAGPVVPRQDRAIRTRERIFAAAVAVFSGKGPHGARIDEIARRAKVNKQRIYAYYGSKSGLFEEVLRQGFAAMNAEESGLLRLGENDIPALPALILAAYMRAHERVPHFWRLLSWENLAGAPHAGVLRGLQDPAFKHLRGLYELGQRRGSLAAEVSFETFIFSLIAVSFFFFANRQTMSISLDLDLAAPQVKARFIQELGRVFGSAGSQPRRPKEAAE